jgi:hypothetical protein
MPIAKFNRNGNGERKENKLRSFKKLKQIEFNIDF